MNCPELTQGMGKNLSGFTQTLKVDPPSRNLGMTESRQAIASESPKNSVVGNLMAIAHSEPMFFPLGDSSCEVGGCSPGNGSIFRVHNPGVQSCQSPLWQLTLHFDSPLLSQISQKSVTQPDLILLINPTSSGDKLRLD